MGGGGHETTTNNEVNDTTMNTKNINDINSKIENEWHVKNSETTYHAGDKVYGRSADISDSANGGLRCIGMALGDPRCHMHLQNLVSKKHHKHSKKSHSKKHSKHSLRDLLLNLDSTKTNVHQTSSHETNTVNNIKNILKEHNTTDDVLNGTLVMGNRYLMKGNYNTGIQKFKLMLI